MSLWNRKPRKRILFIFDVVSFYVLAVLLLLLTRVVTTPALSYGVRAYFLNATLLIAVMTVCRLVWDVYRAIWRDHTASAAAKLLFADTVGGLMAFLVSYCYMKLVDETYYVGLWFFVLLSSLTALLSLGSRFVYSMLFCHFNPTEPDMPMEAESAVETAPVTEADSTDETESATEEKVDEEAAAEEDIKSAPCESEAQA